MEERPLFSVAGGWLGRLSFPSFLTHIEGKYLVPLQLAAYAAIALRPPRNTLTATSCGRILPRFFFGRG